VLGEEWALKASGAKFRPALWSALVYAKSHTTGAAAVLEWALRLFLLADVDGIADVRRDLSRDVTVGRSLHTQLQLEVAGHARRLGWPVRLEPSGSASPGDVAFDVQGGSIVVETKALSERERTRDERIDIGHLTDHLQFVALTRGLWLAGHLHRSPTDDEAVAVERWIKATEMGQGRRLHSLPGIELYLVPRDAFEGHVLRSPEIRDELLPRMVGAIGDKARQMKGSDAGWLRLTTFTGLWATTPWGLSPLAEKLPVMAEALAAELGGDVPAGIVLSSAAGLHNGEPDETVTDADYGIAARRAVAPVRGREAIIMPFSKEGHEQVDEWLQLVDAERDWLDWALAEVGLGTAAEIFASQAA
jgi:hypothetical protein